MVCGNNSQTICKKCAAGQFAAGENGNETAPGDPKLSCVACEEGKYSAGGWTTCQECRAGQRWVDVTTPCEDCVAGTNFSDQSGQLVCTSCKECVAKEGQFTTAKCTVTSDTRCTACPARTFVAGGACETCTVCAGSKIKTTSCTNTINTKCDPCAEGDETRKSYGGNETCVKCPAGKADQDEDSGSTIIVHRFS